MISLLKKYLTLDGCDNLKDIVQLFANLATIFGAIIALGIFFQGFSIYRDSAKFNSEAKSVDLYRDYLNYAQENWDSAEISIYLSDSSSPPDQYIWLVNYTLATASSIYKLTSGDASWVRVIDSMINPHMNYIKNSKLDIRQYGEEFYKFYQTLESRTSGKKK